MQEEVESRTTNLMISVTKQHQKKPSVLKELRRLVSIARSMPQKVRKREQERDR